VLNKCMELPTRWEEMDGIKCNFENYFLHHRSELKVSSPESVPQNYELHSSPVKTSVIFV
jgi:hypothetical protein